MGQIPTLFCMLYLPVCTKTSWDWQKGMNERNDITSASRDQRTQTQRDGTLKRLTHSPEHLDFSCANCWWWIKPLFMQVCPARVSMLSWLVTVFSSITQMALFVHLHTEYCQKTADIVFAGHFLLFHPSFLSFLFVVLPHGLQKVILTFISYWGYCNLLYSDSLLCPTCSLL